MDNLLVAPLFLAGFAVGILVWSNIWGILLATLPVYLELSKSGKLKRKYYVAGVEIISPIAGFLCILTLIFWFSVPLFSGTLLSCFVTFFYDPMGKLSKSARKQTRKNLLGRELFGVTKKTN